MPAQDGLKTGCILDSIMIAAEKKCNGYELYIKMSFLRIICELMIRGKLVLASSSRSSRSERLKNITGFIRENYTQLHINAVCCRNDRP